MERILKEGKDMFKAKLTADVLKEIIEVSGHIVDEIAMNLNSDGLSIKAVDPSHVAMVDMNLSKNAFQEFEADEVSIAVEMDKMREIMKLAKSGSVITMEHDAEKNRLNVTVGNILRRMGLLSSSSITTPKVPELELPASVILNTDEIKQGIKAAESISDHVTIIIEPESFSMEAKGDTDEVRLKLAKDQLIEINCTDKQRSMFPLDYFSNMIKAASNSSNLKINLGTDFPVRLEFTIAGGNGEVTYLLAPRIED